MPSTAEETWGGRRRRDLLERSWDALHARRATGDPLFDGLRVPPEERDDGVGSRQQCLEVRSDRKVTLKPQGQPPQFASVVHRPFTVPQAARQRSAQSHTLGRADAPMLSCRWRRWRLTGKLDLVEFSIEAAHGHELGVRAALGQPGLFDHEDRVGTPDGRQWCANRSSS